MTPRRKTRCNLDGRAGRPVQSAAPILIKASLAPRFKNLVLLLELRLVLHGINEPIPEVTDHKR